MTGWKRRASLRFERTKIMYLNEMGMSECARKVCRGIWDITDGKRHSSVQMAWAAGVLFAILAVFSLWGGFLSLMTGGADRTTESILPHIRAVSLVLIIIAIACAGAAAALETRWHKGRQASGAQQKSLEEIARLLADNKIDSWQKLDRLQAEIEASLQENKKIRETMGKAAVWTLSAVPFGASAFLLALSFNKLYDEIPETAGLDEFGQMANEMLGLVATLFPGLMLIGITLAAMAGFVIWAFYTAPFFSKIVVKQNAIACLWEIRYQSGEDTFPSAIPQKARPERVRKTAQNRQRRGSKERKTPRERPE